MATKWQDVEKSRAFQDLSREDRAAARDQYWRDVVRPQIADRAEIPAAKRAFMERSNDAVARTFVPDDVVPNTSGGRGSSGATAADWASPAGQRTLKSVGKDQPQPAADQGLGLFSSAKTALGGLMAPKKSILDEPMPEGQQTPEAMADPMLNPSYVEGVRAELGNLAPEKRMQRLSELGAGTDVKARAAREVMRQAKYQNSAITADDESKAGLMGYGMPAFGPNGKAGKVAVPDVTPTFGDVARGTSAAEIAQRRMLAGDVVAERNSAGSMADRYQRTQAADTGLVRKAADIGVAATGGAVTGFKLISDAFGADSQVSSALAEAGKFVDGLKSAAAEQDSALIQSYMKSAENKGWAEQIAAASAAAQVAPATLIAQGLGTSVPVILAALLPGVRESLIGSLAAAGTIGAAQAAGAIKGGIYEEVEKELRASGMSPAEAKERAAAAQTYMGDNKGNIFAGMALGALASMTGAEGIARNMIRSALGKKTAGDVAKAAVQPVGGLVTTTAVAGAKEAAPEFLQGSQEQYAKNRALQEEGFAVSSGRGVISQGALEAVAGFGSGAALNIGQAVQNLLPRVAADHGMSPKAAAAIQQAAAQMPPEQAAAFVERAMNGMEKRGLVKKIGAALSWRTAITQPGDVIEQPATPTAADIFGEDAPAEAAPAFTWQGNPVELAGEPITGPDGKQYQPVMSGGKPAFAPLEEITQGAADVGVADASGRLAGSSGAEQGVQPVRSVASDGSVSDVAGGGDRDAGIAESADVATAPVRGGAAANPALTTNPQPTTLGTKIDARPNGTTGFSAADVLRRDAVKAPVAEQTAPEVDPQTGEVLTPAPKRGEFATEEDALAYVSQQRRNGGGNLKITAVPVQTETGWMLVSQGEPGYEQARAEAEQRRAAPVVEPEAPVAEPQAPQQSAAPAKPVTPTAKAQPTTLGQAPISAQPKNAPGFNAGNMIRKEAPQDVPTPEPLARQEGAPQAAQDAPQGVAPDLQRKQADAYANRVAAVASELAGQVQEEAREPDFAPSELNAVLDSWAQESKVDRAELQSAFLSQLKKSDLSDARKRQVLKAVASAKPTKPAKPSIKADMEKARQMRADYFTPGNVVKSYGGHDRVIAYTPPDAPGGNWSVKVQAVEKRDGQWVPVARAEVRQHSTQPDMRELKAGPVERAPVAAPAEAATKEAENDYLTELFGGESQAPAQQEPAKVDVADAESTERVRQAIKQELARAEAQYTELSGRVYKANKSRVDLRGDGPSSQESLSIGGINERRRSNAMAELTEEINALSKLQKQVESDSGAQALSDKLKATMAEAKRAVEGGSSVFKTIDEQFQYAVLDSLNFRGPGGKGSVTRNGLSQALLAMVAPQAAPAATQPAKARPKTPKHPEAVRGSAALASISKSLGGIHPDLQSDLAEKVQRTRTSKTGKKTAYTVWDNPPVPGVGPLFRAGGTKDVSEIARVLEEAGFLPVGTVAADGLEAIRLAEDIIKTELRQGGSTTRVGDADAIDTEMRRRAEMAMDAEADAWESFSFAPDDLEESGYIAASPEIRAAVEQLTVDAEAAGVDVEAIRDEVARNLGEDAPQDEYEAAIRDQLQQAIAQARASTGGTDAGSTRAGNQDRGIAAEQTGSTREPGQGGSDQGLTLEAQTPDELRAKAQREAAALKAEQDKKAAEQRRLSNEAAAREAKARADATVDDFQLGQDADQQMSGMGDMFADAPAEATAKPAEPDALNQTLEQWATASYESSEYRDRMLRKAGGDEQRAALMAAANDFDGDRTAAELRAEAKRAHFQQLMDAPRTATLALPVYDSLTPAMQIEAQRHFFDLDSRLIRRDQDRASEQVKRMAEQRKPYEAAMAEVQAEIDKRDSTGPMTQVLRDLMARRDRLQDALVQIGQGKEPDSRLIKPASKTKFSLSKSLPESIVVDGKRRPTTNSKGQPIAADEASVTNFWRWFSDSQAVDAEGRPLVLYHGTTADITSFDPKKLGEATGASSAGKGFFFVDRSDVADSYANYAATDAPVRRALAEADKAEKRGDWDAYDAAVQRAEELEAQLADSPLRGQNTLPVYLRVQAPRTMDAGGELFSQIGEKINGFLLLAKAKKNDGALIKNLDDDPRFSDRVGNHWVVFDQKNIKSAIGNSGAFDGTNPDIRFSLGSQLTGPRLSAIHSISPDGLIYADKMGGLAVPSIGIVTEEKGGVDGFGKITLIGGRDLADPKRVPAFDSDAYTTTWPQPEYPKAKSDAAMKLVNELRPFTKSFDDNGDSQVFDEAVNKANPSRIISDMLRDRGAKAMWLANVGKITKPVMRPARINPEWAASPAWVKFAKSADWERDNLSRNDPKYIQHQQEATEAARKAVEQWVESNFRENDNEASRAELRKILTDSVDDNFDDDGLLRSSSQYRARQAVKLVGTKEVDRRATDDMLDAKIGKRQAEFKAWIEARVMSMFGEPFVKVGGRKLPYTIENIADAMTSSRVAGQEKTMTFSAGQARAAAATKFVSLNQMRSAAETDISNQAEYTKAKEASEKLLDAFRSMAAEFYSHKDWRGNIDTWGAMDDSMKAIGRVIKAGVNEKNMRSALTGEGFRNVPTSVIKAGVDAAAALRNAPVPYFEAKPQRVVKLNEFYGAVVPKNISKEAKAVLVKNGLDIKTYDPEEEGARDVAIKSLRAKLDKSGKDVLFSFAGQNAKTADKHALSTAQQRLDAGEDAEAVRKATGWHKGADGKFRFEISDDMAIARGTGTFGEVVMRWYKAGVERTGDQLYKTTIGDVLYHSRLFDAYPALRDVEVQMMPAKEKTKGRVVNAQGESPIIQINEDLPSDEWKSTMLHEIQHGIQNIEGFATGGSPSQFAGVDPESQAELDRINNILNSGNYDMRDYDALLKKKRDLLNNAKPALSSFEQYKRLAGEVEARNTQARAGMTDAQRAATPPEQTADVPASDVIVTFNGKTMASAPTPANAGQSLEEKALQALSENDDLFAMPKSSGTTVEAIAADVDPEIQVTRRNVPGEQRYELKMPGGDIARLTIRKPNPYGETIYSFDLADGEMTNVITERPGENPDDVPFDIEEVFIDASALKTGTGGAKIYQIATTLAHNTDRLFIGDPAGLSDDALRRRSEQMLSSALKFGTTKHLAPHPRQVTGDSKIGVPPLKWVYGDDMGNIRRLVDLNVKALENAFPAFKKIDFDVNTGTLINAETGQAINRGVLGRRLTRLRTGGDSSLSVAATGGTTFARGALLRALLREESRQSASGGRRGSGVGLLARLARVGSSSPAFTKKLFYSLDQGLNTSPQGDVPRVTSIVDAIRQTWANAPEIVVAASMEDPQVPADARQAYRDLRASGAQGSPEGFFLNGKVYMIADALPTANDVARVLAHESLGHYGLAGVFGDELNPMLDRLAKALPDKVRAKAEQYGLDVANEADRRQAAEEYLAELAETRPSSTWVQKLIAHIKGWLRQNLPGLGDLKMTDADVVAQYIVPARGFVERGQSKGVKGLRFSIGSAPSMRGTEEQARAQGFTMKAYRGVSLSSPFNDTGTTWMTTSREVAQAYAEEVMGYDDPGVLEVMVNPSDLPRHDASRLSDEQREEMGADEFGNPQAVGIYDRSDDHPLGGSRRNVTVIHAPKTAVFMLDNGQDARFSLSTASLPATIEVDGKQRPTTNSKGQPIAATEDGVRNFWRWFSSSRVVDADGKPLVVYHGNRGADITEFKPAGGNDEAGARALNMFRKAKAENKPFGYMDFRMGSFFSPDPTYAGNYTGDGGLMYPVYVKAENPVSLSQNNAQRATLYERNRTPDALFMMEGDTINEIAVLDPTQVKSATGNDGTFGPANPSIRFSLSQRVQSVASGVGSAKQLLDDMAVNTKVDGRLHWWHKTVGSMNHLASKSEPFRRVYEGIQTFIQDASKYAAAPADLAPDILIKLDGLGDIIPFKAKILGYEIGKSPMSPEDAKVLSSSVFHGTLLWTRDKAGRPMLVTDAEKLAEGMDTETKARTLLRNGKVTADKLKMMQASKIADYESWVDGQFEQAFLKAGIVFTPAELKKHFGATDEQVKLYQQFRAAVDKSLTSLAVSDMLRLGGKDAADIADEAMQFDDATKAAEFVADHLRKVADLEKKDRPQRYDTLNDTANEIIGKAEKVADLIAKGYAPLMRFGTHKVDVVGADGERIYFGMFETPREAAAMARKMKAEYPDATVTRGTMSQKEHTLYAGVTPETLELFGEMLGLDDQGANASDEVYQEYLKKVKNQRSAMKRLIHRKGVAGFSEDAGRVLAGFVYSNGRQISGNLHASKISKALQDFPRDQGEAKDQAVELYQYVMNPQEEGQAIRSLMFGYFLGGSIASAVVNLTQTPALTFPYLSQWGAGNAAKQIGLAMRDLGRKSTGDKDLDAAMKLAEERGITAPQEVFHLMAQAQGKSTLRGGDGTITGKASALTGNALSRASLAWGKPFEWAEQANRRITFMSAYRLAVANNMADPFKFAEKAVEETQFVSNKGNKPRWARGAVGGTLFTFKTYTVNHLSLMNRLWTQGEPGSMERRNGRRAVALSMLMLFVMAGADGLPGEGMAEDLLDGILQRLGYNFTSKEAKRELIMETLGMSETAHRFITKGLSGLPGAPIDVSGRLGMGRPIPGTGIFPKKDDYTSDVLEVLGPVGSLAKNTFNAAGRLVDGIGGAARTGELSELGRGLTGAATELAPVAGKNVIKAAEMLATGKYKDTRGNLVTEVDKVDAIMKGIGFQPNVVARKQEDNRRWDVLAQLNKQMTQDITERWAQGEAMKLEGRQQADADKVAQGEKIVKRAAAMLEVWNRQNPDSQIAGTTISSGVASRVRKAQLDRDQRGLLTTPKGLRAARAQEMQAAD